MHLRVWHFLETTKSFYWHSLGPKEIQLLNSTMLLKAKVGFRRITVHLLIAILMKYRKRNGRFTRGASWSGKDLDG
jgi:hypothetical protein